MAEEYEQLFADTERGLQAIDFFKTRYHEHIMRTVRTLFYRAAPDSRELALLRAIFIEIVRTIEPEKVGLHPALAAKIVQYHFQHGTRIPEA